MQSHGLMDVGNTSDLNVFGTSGSKWSCCQGGGEGCGGEVQGKIRRPTVNMLSLRCVVVSKWGPLERTRRVKLTCWNLRCLVDV